MPIPRLLLIGSLYTLSCAANLYVGEHKICTDSLPETMPFAEWASIFRANGTSHGYASSSEQQLRELIYHENLQKILQHNSQADLGIHTHRQGVNQFTDLTPEEFKSLVSTGYTQRSPSRIQQLKEDDTPPSVDWRTKGAVTPVKNQGSCGSCWAFATTGAMEGAFAIATSTLRSLSEQQLVDCAGGSYGNKGCSGGNFDGAFNYIKNNTGLDSEQDYPYQVIPVLI